LCCVFRLCRPTRVVHVMFGFYILFVLGVWQKSEQLLLSELVELACGVVSTAINQRPNVLLEPWCGRLVLFMLASNGSIRTATIIFFRSASDWVGEYANGSNNARTDSTSCRVGDCLSYTASALSRDLVAIMTLPGAGRRKIPSFVDAAGMHADDRSYMLHWPCRAVPTCNCRSRQRYIMRAAVGAAYWCIDDWRGGCRVRASVRSIRTRTSVWTLDGLWRNLVALSQCD